VAVLALAVAGCGGDDPGHRTLDHYVALGDSYTAGTGAGPLVTGAGAGCGEAKGSYPRLVAGELGTQLTDVSCAGAKTSNGTETQATTTGSEWPPQLDSLSEDTDLVSVGLGYNDFGFFGLLTFGCAVAAASAASAGSGTPCQDQVRARDLDAGALADRIGDHLRAVLDEVHDRAPDAEVLLVGYPQLVPDEGTCPQLPLAAGDYAYVREQFGHLDEAMQDAADDAGASFVDVYAASHGHDICAADPWVNGGTVTSRAAAYHPFASGQRAVAGLVVKAVRD
jgi:lysophospholipase L1-like esterase